jgi:phytoene dehydrogenase-like protein
MHDEYDVIVVGGGFAGLATGALLAHDRFRVLILERRPVLGGRALVVKQDGFTLNYGLHYIVGGHANPHHRILKQIGKLQAAPLAPVDPRKLHRRRGGQMYVVPSTPLSILNTRLLTGRGKAGLLKAFLALMTADPETLWHVPVGTWLDGVATEPSLRAFLLDLGAPLTFEPHPEQVSAAHFILAIRPLMLANGKVALYPVGGWLPMFEAFKARIEEARGEVRMKAPAERLAMEDARVAGVWSRGELTRCRAVVMALPPNELDEFLKDTPIPGLDSARLKSIRPTMGVAVDLGVMGLNNDHIATIELPELSGTLGIHDLFTPSLVPPGGHLIQFLRFLTPEQMQDKSEIERTEPMLLDLLETIWRGIREKIVLRRTLIRPVLTSASHRYDQPRPTLLPLHIPEVAGLFLAGDATAAPGELSGVAGESALLCARLVAQRMKAATA